MMKLDPNAIKVANLEAQDKETEASTVLLTGRESYAQATLNSQI